MTFAVHWTFSMKIWKGTVYNTRNMIISLGQLVYVAMSSNRIWIKEQGSYCFTMQTKCQKQLPCSLFRIVVLFDEIAVNAVF